VPPADALRAIEAGCKAKIPALWVREYSASGLNVVSERQSSEGRLAQVEIQEAKRFYEELHRERQSQQTPSEAQPKRSLPVKKQ